MAGECSFAELPAVIGEATRGWQRPPGYRRASCQAHVSILQQRGLALESRWRPRLQTTEGRGWNNAQLPDRRRLASRRSLADRRIGQAAPRHRHARRRFKRCSPAARSRIRTSASPVTTRAAQGFAEAVGKKEVVVIDKARANAGATLAVRLLAFPISAACSAAAATRSARSRERSQNVIENGDGALDHHACRRIDLDPDRRHAGGAPAAARRQGRRQARRARRLFREASGRSRATRPSASASALGAARP